MTDAHPQRAAKRTRRSADHHIVVRIKPDQPTNMSLLAEALMLHAAEQRAKDEGSPVPHLAGMQKLAYRRRTHVEGDDD
jgi:hypothetical protein